MRSPSSVAFFLAVLLVGATSLRAQVAGQVVDSVTGSPIAGALVTLQATHTRTEAASDGSFLLTTVSGTGLVVVGAKKGYYNAGVTVGSTPASGVVIALDPVTIWNDPNYGFLGPFVCGGCHPGQEADWLNSPMAKAGNNSWVYDIYDGTGSSGGQGGFVYTRDSVHATANPASECAACHQPEPWIAQPHSPLEPIGSISAAALHGISCETCHKMADIDETKPNFPGIWPAVVTINRPAVPHQVQYGRLGDATYTLPGLMRPSYQPQFEGATCAGCHQDKNDPDGNGNFEEANGIISEPTWLEWLASPYSDETSPNYASCVDCHMPPSGASTVSPLSGLQRPLDTIRSHRIEGTSPAFLENAVDMSLSVQPGTTDIQVTVDVANTMTGHHVPTGVTVRNMILLVEAWRVQDGQRLTKTGGQVIHALGGVGAPEQGYYAGLPGKLYAKHNHNAAGNGPTFFTDATGILWDNRIPALTTDTTSYTFSPPPGGGDIAVRARLIYRRSFRFLTDAKGWTTTGHGDPLEDIAAPYFGHLMEEEVWTNSTTGPVEIFGTGCGGLVATSSGSPSLGLHSFEVQLAGALAATPAVLLFGNSRTQWGSLSLPHDLGFLGAPNCQLLVSPDMSWIHTTDFQGNATQAFAVPIIPAFAGVTFHAQWITPHGGNSIGWAFSNGLSITAQP